MNTSIDLHLHDGRPKLRANSYTAREGNHSWLTLEVTTADDQCFTLTMHCRAADNIGLAALAQAINQVAKTYFPHDDEEEDAA